MSEISLVKSICQMPNCEIASIGTASFRLFESVGNLQEMTIEICEKDLWLLTRAGIVGSAKIRRSNGNLEQIP